MIVFPNAKINIGLNILSKRPDNYHNIQTIFYPIQLFDVLEIVPSDEFKLTVSGIELDTEWEKNLVFKAYNLMKLKYNIPAVEIYLEKRIPFGAGLGGGSADAAFTLKALNDLFQLNLTDDILLDLASQLGADCAFFIYNLPSFATGIGNILEKIELDLSDFYLVLAKPDVSVATKNVYSLILPNSNVPDLRELINKPVFEWKYFIFNDFEKVIFPKYPIIKELKEAFYSKGAIYSSMTGSGSAVYALFSKKDKPNFNDLPVIYNEFENSNNFSLIFGP